MPHNIYNTHHPPPPRTDRHCSVIYRISAAKEQERPSALQKKRLACIGWKKNILLRGGYRTYFRKLEIYPSLYWYTMYYIPSSLSSDHRAHQTVPGGYSSMFFSVHRGGFGELGQTVIIFGVNDVFCVYCLYVCTLRVVFSFWSAHLCGGVVFVQALHSHPDAGATAGGKISEKSHRRERCWFIFARGAVPSTAR